MEFTDLTWEFPSTGTSVSDVRFVYAQESPYFHRMFSMNPEKRTFQVPDVMDSPDVFDVIQSVVWGRKVELPQDPDVLSVMTHVADYLHLQKLEDLCLESFQMMYTFIPKQRSPQVLRPYCRLSQLGALHTKPGEFIQGLIRKNMFASLCPTSTQGIKSLQCVISDYPSEDFPVIPDLPLRTQIIRWKTLNPEETELPQFEDPKDPDPGSLLTLCKVLGIPMTTMAPLIPDIQTITPSDIPERIPQWIHFPSVNHMDVYPVHHLSSPKYGYVHMITLTRRGVSSTIQYANINIHISNSDSSMVFTTTGIGALNYDVICITSTLICPRLTPVSTRTEIGSTGRDDFSVSQTLECSSRTPVFFDPSQYPSWTHGDFFLLHTYIQMKVGRPRKKPRKRKGSQGDDILSIPMEHPQPLPDEPEPEQRLAMLNEDPLERPVRLLT